MPSIGVKLRDSFPKSVLKVDNITLIKGKYTYLNSKIVKEILTPYKNFLDYETTIPKSLGEVIMEKPIIVNTPIIDTLEIDDSQEEKEVDIPIENPIDTDSINDNKKKKKRKTKEKIVDLDSTIEDKKEETQEVEVIQDLSEIISDIKESEDD